MHERVIHLSNGLLSTGMCFNLKICSHQLYKPVSIKGIQSKQNVVIFAETRAEWIMFALSLFRINVPGKIHRLGFC